MMQSFDTKMQRKFEIKKNAAPFFILFLLKKRTNKLYLF